MHCNSPLLFVKWNYLFFFIFFAHAMEQHATTMVDNTPGSGWPDVEGGAAS